MNRVITWLVVSLVAEHVPKTVGCSHPTADGVNAFNGVIMLLFCTNYFIVDVKFDSVTLL